MDRAILFEKYKKFEMINKDELNLIIDYICGNLNSCFCNYNYWYNMYCYATKSRIVIRHREQNNQLGFAKLGECVCENEVVNFLEKENKKCNCNKGCSNIPY